MAKDIQEKVKLVEKPEYAENVYPKKKYWNFKAVFQKNSAGIPEVNIWNRGEILMEFH